MDAIYSRPCSRHNNTRGRRDARLKNMCIKVGFSDDSKGTFVCFFLLWCFMNFGKDTWYLFPFFPGILHLWFWWLWCFFFCIFHFFFWPARTSNYRLYMFQWCHIDSECRFISNNLNRIHSHLKWPIMSNDSECATSQISGLSDPFGARSIHEILSCSLKRSRETSELGKFHHGFAPEMVNFMGEKWENIDERKGEKLGKRWWKTWETLNIWKKHWKTRGNFWGNTKCVSYDFPCFVPIP